MNCCGQCQGIEELFDDTYVTRELKTYRAKGPIKTTRWLVDALKAEGIQNLTLLDIGGGVGAVQHALLPAGASEATDVDASKTYIKVASEEARQRGIAERIHFLHGNFVNIAPQIAPADIVTLDRVVCCFPDMENLVELSAARAKKLYGLVYPRDAWWVKIGIAIENLVFRLQRSTFRSFVHPTSEVDAIIRRQGLSRTFFRQTLFWQVLVYSR
jgi:magnesium-protoporphyrin O-methyltransferase